MIVTFVYLRWLKLKVRLPRATWLILDLPNLPAGLQAIEPSDTSTVIIRNRASQPGMPGIVEQPLS